MCIKHQDFQKFGLSNFHSLKIVGRGSETQLEVGEKIFNIT